MTSFGLVITPLAPGEETPYDLLLLADPERDMVDGYLSGSQVFLVRDQSAPDQTGTPVGVLVLTPLAEGEWEIKNIAVREDRQGAGIGRQLLNFAVDEARRRGIQALEIGTGNSSLGQLALYQKCGFRVDRVEHDFFTRNYPEPIFENGIQCRDMIMLRMVL
jgi:ribosomal protein S18 acetylase RimI-like enzyme